MTDPSRILSGVRWGQGAPMVLLHGFLGDHNDWPEALGEHFDCLALDLPGHGLSQSVELQQRPAFDEVVQRLLETLAYQGVARFHLLGYSLGGRLALALAHHLSQHTPNRLLSLTLESAHPGLLSETEKAERLRSDAAWFQRMATEPATQWLDAWYRQGVFADLSEPARAAMVQARLGNRPHALAALYLGTSLGHQPDLRALTLPCPVTLITGANDPKFTELARQWCHPNWQHHVIESAGHNVHRARPDAFLATLRPR
ncbi:2-succinyl-6-hydroxy-2,4-cyclohexadiene-1-carboxylate synthase [Marinobacter hydrocarbonoclasticus]|nr:2-succinyl-6-hydroxy-2,4-cyclohexadiene-1-carboxylate synthase [Marinobacter nauticus]